MQTISVYKLIEQGGDITPKAIQMMKAFGVTKDRLYKLNFKCHCSFDMEQGDVVFITGASGSGKSVIMNLIRAKLPADEVFDIESFQFNNDLRAIDQIPCDLYETLGYFCKTGLADLPTEVNFPKNLSSGQQWRLKLAAALASKKKYIVADEFCSNLDIYTAVCIADNLRLHAKKNKVTFILASSREDFTGALMPDVIIRRDLTGDTVVEYRFNWWYVYDKRPTA